MLAHPTLELLHALGLHGVAKGFKDFSKAKPRRAASNTRNGSACCSNTKRRYVEKRFETRARAGRLRHSASAEDVDYHSPRGRDRALFLKLAACDWINQRRNLLITRAAGLGTSWLACALGQKACRQDVSVLYYRVPRLFTDSWGDCAGRRALRQAPALQRSLAPNCSYSTIGARTRSPPIMRARSPRNRRGSLRSWLLS